MIHLVIGVVVSLSIIGCCMGVSINDMISCYRMYGMGDYRSSHGQGCAVIIE